MFDAGVEYLMQCETAKCLHAVPEIASEGIIDFEHSTSSLPFAKGITEEPFRRGRIDLSLDIPSSKTYYLIEFKRFLNPAMIAGDLARLSRLLIAADRFGIHAIGFVAGVMYLQDDNTHNFGSEYDSNLVAARSLFPATLLTARVSPEERLDSRFQHRQRYSRHLAIAIQVERFH